MIKLAFFSLFLISGAAFAEAPEQIERETYRSWLEEIGSVQSVYLDSVFDWYEEQLILPLPPSVDQDPDRLVVSIDKPLQDAIQAEANGDVEKGVTYGLETYGMIQANLDLVLETILFRWGKPVGEVSGVTYPFDLVFGYRKESLFPFWGGNTFRTETVMKNGGVAKDQNDISSLVLRRGSNGTTLVGSFLAPNGRSASTSSISVIHLKPTADGNTEYRVSGRYTGQSYALFGIEFGRRNYGFNQAKIRQGQRDFYQMVEELKTTGKIRERKPAKDSLDSGLFPAFLGI